MKTLTLHISESIYEKVWNFLSLIPKDKIQISEQSNFSHRDKINFSFEEFENKWAGFLLEEDIDDNWKKKKIDYLNKKHS